MSSAASSDAGSSNGERTQEMNAIKNKPKHASFWHIYFFSIVFVIGDLVASWNHGLIDGLWEYLIANFIVGTAFVCLALCQAEMTSMLPFSGGTYGFARVTMGPFIGYLVGCLEVIANWIFVVETVEFFGDIVHHMVGGGAELQPVWWMFFFIPAIALQLAGAKYFYPACIVLGVLSLLLVFLYVLAAAPQMNTHKYVIEIDNRFFADGIVPFLTLLPRTSHLWLGLQSVSLACEDTVDATKTIPHAFLAAVLTLFVLSFIIIISVVSHSPGVVEIQHSLVAMNHGYADAFHIPERAATVFSLFAVFAAGLTHMFAYSRQLQALSRSRLISKYFAHTLGISDAPAVALLIGNALALAALFLVWGGFKDEVYILLYASIIGAFIVYAGVFASFCIFKISFTTMPREFINPLGYYGVAYGAVVFLLCLVSTLVFEEGHNESAVVCGVATFVIVVYYYFIASKMQTYSKEEQHLLLKLYVIKGNAKKRGNKKRSRAGSVASGAQQKSVGHQKSKSHQSSGNSDHDQNKDGSEIDSGENCTETRAPSSTLISNNRVAPDIEPSAAATSVPTSDKGTTVPSKLSNSAKKTAAVIMELSSKALDPFRPNFEASNKVKPANSQKSSKQDGLRDPVNVESQQQSTTARDSYNTPGAVDITGH